MPQTAPSVSSFEVLSAPFWVPSRDDRLRFLLEGLVGFTSLDEEEEQQLETLKTNITENLAILIDKKLDLFSSTVNNK